ncbi:aldehyde dehydrogenase family protein [Streptosporangium sp. NPDC002544]|uniref:aldehyde dehydrogenase family protein n=1 Tax=Streptosporangium sp. NPDC002544 TaxID=3154538 RepID=UPI00331A9E6B
MPTFNPTAEGIAIGGEIVEPTGDQVVDLVAPSTEQTYATVRRPSVTDADRAAAAARETFDSGVWSGLPLVERVEVLDRALSHVEESVEEIARLCAFEIGAPLRVTRASVHGSLKVIRAMGAMALETSDVVPASRGWDYEVQYDPIGVALEIVPWNSPFTGTMRHAAQALLAGCTVIAKPPPDTPFSSLVWARALTAAGLPAGAFNIVPADAAVSEHLVTHPAVDKIGFVGGTGIGRRVAELAGRHLKRYVLELGGKSAAVVLDDADLDLVAAAAANSVYFNSGQICSALSRIIVPRERIGDAVAALQKKVDTFVVGDPFDDATTMGPMASRAHYERVRTAIGAAAAEGATLEYGGDRPPGLSHGFYLQPTLFSGTNDMAVAQEELFGPVAVLIPHDGDDDALRLANDSVFGLGGSVFSADTDRARAVAARMRTGSVTINAWATNQLGPRDPHKDSGWGTSTGIEGYQAYRSTRIVNLRPVN